MKIILSDLVMRSATMLSLAAFLIPSAGCAVHVQIGAARAAIPAPEALEVKIRTGLVGAGPDSPGVSFPTSKASPSESVPRSCRRGIGPGPSLAMVVRSEEMGGTSAGLARPLHMGPEMEPCHSRHRGCRTAPANRPATRRRKLFVRLAAEVDKQLLRQIVQEHPESADPLENLAAFEARFGHFAESANDYAKAIKVDPQRHWNW